MVSRKNLIIFSIFALAIFLRFFRIEENFIFSGEVGHNFLAIKNAIISREIPLIGPPTSHPWLYFGPLFYWIFGPLLWLAKFNPLAGAYFGAASGILVIFLNYLVVKEIFGEKTALFSSFLIAISPLWLQFSREARFFSFVLPFVYLFLWVLMGGVKLAHPWGVKLLLGLLLGMMLNFHYTALIFIPVVLSLVLTKNLRMGRRESLISFIGFLIPNLPLSVYDLGHQFKMISSLLVWVPYRIAGFVGIYPKNTVSLNIIKENFASFYKFFNLSFLPEGNLLAVVFLILITIFTIKKIRQPLILFWLGWGMLVLFIHGAPPIHYFLPLFPLPIIIFSLFLADLWRKKLGKLIVCGLLFIISFINLAFFFSEKWFFLPQDKMWLKPLYVPYSLQKEVAKTIVKDAAGKPYNLLRVGPYDYFEGNYAQNYQYLAWWFGNEPIQEKTKLRYTIYEAGEIVILKEGE